jgi:hypothetical protein
MAEPTTLRWTLEEIIDAVRAEIDPPTQGKMSLKPVRLYAFARLALGKPQGRAAPIEEDFLLRLIFRVQSAIEKGLDPIDAYKMPLPHEAPLGHGNQLSPAYQRDAAMMNIIDDHLRGGTDLSAAIMYGVFGEERTHENEARRGEPA